MNSLLVLLVLIETSKQESFDKQELLDLGMQIVLSKSPSLPLNKKQLKLYEDLKAEVTPCEAA